MQQQKAFSLDWLKRVAAALSLVLCAAAASSAFAADEVKLHADTLISRSGVDAAISVFPGMVMMGIGQARQQGAPITDEVMRAMDESAREVFAYEGLLEDVRSLLLQTVKAEHLADWVAFYASSVGVRMATADAGWSDPDMQMMVMQQGPRIMQELAGEPARMALLQSLLQASHTVERASSSALSFALAMEWGMISTMPPSPDLPDYDQLRDMIEESRFVIQGQMAQLTLAQASVLYKDFSLDDLRAVLVQMNSDAGQAFYRDFSQAFEALLVQRGERLGVRVGQRLGSRST